MRDVYAVCLYVARCIINLKRKCKVNTNRFQPQVKNEKIISNLDLGIDFNWGR